MESRFWVSISDSTYLGVISPKGMYEGLKYCFNGVCKVVACTGVKHALTVCGKDIGTVACGKGEQADNAFQSDDMIPLQYPCPTTTAGGFIAGGFEGVVEKLSDQESNDIWMAAAATALVGAGALYVGYKMYQNRKAQVPEASESNARVLRLTQ